MIRNVMMAAAFCGASAAPLWAGHNNPWAEPGDEIVEQYHDENLEQSDGTPGENEMRGALVQWAWGKLGREAGQGAGQGAGGPRH